MTNFEKIMEQTTLEDYAADRAFFQVCHSELGCPKERLDKAYLNARGRLVLPCFDCWKEYLRSECAANENDELRETK